MKKRQQSQTKIQERALKKRTERKLKLAQQKTQSVRTDSPERHVRQARNYPIEGCWAQKDWMEAGLAVVAIARRQSDKLLTFGTYLVDYFCLGLKNTYCNANVPLARFHNEDLPKIYQGEPPKKITPALAHEIVYGGIEYAEQFGFRPQRDFRLSQYVLDPPDVHPRTGRVEFGKDGKPLYISGPNDNVEQIMRQLARTAGEGNFHYLAHLGSPPDSFDDEEDLNYDEGENDGDQPHPLLWVPPPYGDADEDEEEDKPRSPLWTPRH